MVTGSIDSENTKTLQHRDIRKINLKKFVSIEVRDVGSDSETFAALKLLPSSDEDFMLELKVKPIYKKYNKNKKYVHYGEY